MTPHTVIRSQLERTNRKINDIMKEHQVGSDELKELIQIFYNDITSHDRHDGNKRRKSLTLKRKYIDMRHEISDVITREIL
jgi:hypothetical protein